MDKIVSLGSSLAWYRSWILYCKTAGMKSWNVLEIVLFGFGFRLKRLSAKKIKGMLPNGFEVKFYWNWRAAREGKI